MRVLITGSRTWHEPLTIWRALRDTRLAYGVECLTVVHGACPDGADDWADMWARTVPGFEPERWPAKWDRYGKRAGFLRNTQMVASGPAICLAFIRGGSHGATHCASVAEANGIPTERWEIR
jgi:SLOG family YspA-like protein